MTSSVYNKYRKYNEENNNSNSNSNNLSSSLLKSIKDNSVYHSAGKICSI